MRSKQAQVATRQLLGRLEKIVGAWLVVLLCLHLTDLLRTHPQCVVTNRTPCGCCALQTNFNAESLRRLRSAFAAVANHNGECTRAGFIRVMIGEVQHSQK